jgi:uncharacterized OB-fold protein
MLNITRPLPTIDDDSRPFWQSTKAHAMKLQRCNRCESFWFYPGPVCHHCGSTDFQWVQVAGTGTIYSYTLLQRAKGNPFENDVPIAIALIRLTEGPVLMSNLSDYDADDVRIGLPVEVVYEDVNDEVTLPIFRPQVNP